jgi:hypothetical protein
MFKFIKNLFTKKTADTTTMQIDINEVIIRKVAPKKTRTPAAVKKETKPAAVKKETKPAAVKKETKPAAVKKETKPAAVKKETKPANVVTLVQPTKQPAKSTPIIENTVELTVVTTGNTPQPKKPKFKKDTTKK